MCYQYSCAAGGGVVHTCGAIGMQLYIHDPLICGHMQGHKFLGQSNRGILEL